MTLSLTFAPEPSARLHLQRWQALADVSHGLITTLGPDTDGFADEPSWPLVRADLAPTAGIDGSGFEFGPACGGRSSEQYELPWVSAVFEAIERYCMSLPDRRRIVRRPYDPATDLDPASLLDVDASAAAVEEARAVPRAWVPGSDLDNVPVWLPAQAVHVPFREEDWDEILLRDCVSTGCAAGLSKDWAVVRGLLEILERDAVMLLHFGVAGYDPIQPQELSGATAQMLDDLARHGLETTLLRVHTGLPVAAVVVCVRDPRGPWPSAALGSCARLELNSAVEGALLEAGVYRRNLRSAPGHFGTPVGRRDDIACLTDRASYWYGNDRISALGYVDGQARPGAWSPMPVATTPQVLLDAVGELGPVVVTDITTSDIARLGAYVVKVVAPALQPMYLSELHRTRTSRLRGVDLDEFEPHPFL